MISKFEIIVLFLNFCKFSHSENYNFKFKKILIGTELSIFSSEDYLITNSWSINRFQCLKKCSKNSKCNFARFLVQNCSLFKHIKQKNEIYDGSFWYNHENIKNFSCEGETFNGQSINFEQDFLINLSSRNICSIQSYSFKSAHVLETLVLNYNLITSLNSEIFFNLSKLLNLYLGFNRISLIETDSFTNLSLLNQLFLKKNRLSFLKDNVFVGLSSLSLLDLSSNYLESINSFTFNGLYQLSHLNLAFNLIRSIHSDAFSILSSLLILDIMANKLDSLDDNIFNNLANLSHLDLSENSLSSINLFNQTKLTYLGLYMNNFTYFSKSLPSLTFLDLGYNPLKYINYSLIIQTNQLVPQLEVLYLDGCDLFYIENNIFQTFQQLQDLYFDNNKLTFLNDSLFMNLSSLSKVTIDSQILNIAELQAKFPMISFDLQ